MENITIELLKKYSRMDRRSEFLANEIIAHARVDQKHIVEMHKENALKSRGAAERLIAIVSDLTGQDGNEIEKEMYDVCVECNGTGIDPMSDSENTWSKRCPHCHGAKLDYLTEKEAK
jgi:hypothetical protein